MTAWDVSAADRGRPLRHRRRSSVPRMFDLLRVQPGDSPGLDKRDPGDRLGLEKKEGVQRLDDLHERLDTLQQRLYAEGERSVLLVLQGIDGSGKGGVSRSVFRGLSPPGCRVASFKAPSAAELARASRWPLHAVAPQRGEIGIFTRPHCEDVVTGRLLELFPEEIWKRRPHQICEW